MEFVKKHYEKVLLGVVLLGLAVAVAFLPFKIASEKQALEDKRNALTHPKVKPLTNLDLSLPEAVLKRMAAPAMVDFSPPNKLFNSMKWQKAVNGQLILYDDSHIGPRAMVVTKITPLYLTLTLDSVTVSDSGARYRIGVQKESAANPRDRAKNQKYCGPGDKNEGPADNPTKLTLELNDTGEKAMLTKDQPFKRVDGYMADVRYEPEKMTGTQKRVGMVLHFAGDDYKIVAINKDEVILLAPSNKKTTIKYSASS